MCGNWWETSHVQCTHRSSKPAASQKMHNYNFDNKRFFLTVHIAFNNRFILCCDDEHCAFVETARTSVASTNCAEGVMCMACVDLGYFLDRARLTSLLDLFILRLQQNIPSLFSRSSQHVCENPRGVSCRKQRSIKLFHFRSAG